MKAMDRLLKMYRVYQNVKSDVNVSDIRRRTWKERLFTLPWTPWQPTKYSPKCYLMADGTLIVSPKTKLLLEEALLSEKYDTHSS